MVRVEGMDITQQSAASALMSCSQVLATQHLSTESHFSSHHSYEEKGVASETDEETEKGNHATRQRERERALGGGGGVEYLLLSHAARSLVDIEGHPFGFAVSQTALATSRLVQTV